MHRGFSAISYNPQYLGIAVCVFQNTVYTIAMADEITLSGKKFVSSKRAAEETGYAQDYIGQLARGGSIEAQRVGGLWYVSLHSLRSYKSKPEDAESADINDTDDVVQSSFSVPHAAHDEFVSFDGKDYISASRASQITGYNQDYVGQLARTGKILARQVGNRWFVERSGILAHKEQKDALLAAVQSQSVGIVPAHVAVRESLQGSAYRELKDSSYHSAPAMTYTPEPMVDLIPRITENPGFQDEEFVASADSRVPIRRIEPEQLDEFVSPRQNILKSHRKGPVMPRRDKKYLVGSAALTVVIVLSFGLSLFDGGATFATVRNALPGGVSNTGQPDSSVMLGAAASAFEHYIAFIEDLIVPGMTYTK